MNKKHGHGKGAWGNLEYEAERISRKSTADMDLEEDLHEIFISKLRIMAKDTEEVEDKPALEVMKMNRKATMDIINKKLHHDSEGSDSNEMKKKKTFNYQESEFPAL